MATPAYAELIPLSIPLPDHDLAGYELARLALRANVVYDPEQAWRDEPDAWRKVRSNPEIRHLIEQWNAMVGGRELSVVPASDSEVDEAAAGVIEDLLARVQGFDAARSELSNARFIGSTYARIIGGWDDVRAGGERGRFWVPRALRDVSRSRFSLRNEGDGLRWYVRAIHGPQSGEWVRLDENRRWFVRHVWGATEGNFGYGEGLIRPIYLWAFMISELVKLGMQGADRFALGILAAEVDRLLKIDGTTNETIAANWRTRLRAFRQHGLIIHDKQDKVTLHETSKSGHNMVLELLNYLMTGVRLLVLGSNLPSKLTGDDGGSRAAAEVQEGSTETLVQIAQNRLAEDLTDTLVRLVWDQNKPVLDILGLGEAEMPSLEIRHERRADPRERAEVAALLARELGMQFREDEIYEQTGWSTPRPGRDKVVGPREMPSAAGPTLALPGGMSLAEAVALVEAEPSPWKRRRLVRAIAASCAR